MLAKINFKTITIVSASVLIIILSISAPFLIRHYVRYQKPNVANEYALQIYNHYDYNQMLDTLKSSGSLKNWNSFRRASEKKELEQFFKPGRYVLKEGMSNQQIIRTIANAWQTPTKLVLSGHIRSLDKLASFLSKRCEADSLEFITTIKDSLLMDSLGFSKKSYLGMFIPNTYEVFWTIEPQSLLFRFKKEYDRFWTPERKSKAKSIGLTQEEVSTLASIVVEESKYVPEQPTIAGVYLNRLKRGMRLQADPTVKYAALELYPDIRRILHKHLKIRSPYNTYIHKGLPPGPITIPTISAIDAVLNPTGLSPKGFKLLYFCANPKLDGTHYFASTYRQHLLNAKAYHRIINQREREERKIKAQEAQEALEALEAKKNIETKSTLQ